MGKMIQLAWIEQELAKVAKEFDYPGLDFELFERQKRPTKKHPYYSAFEAEVCVSWPPERSAGIYGGSMRLWFTEDVSEGSDSEFGRKIVFKFIGEAEIWKGWKRIVKKMSPQDFSIHEEMIEVFRQILDKEVTKYVNQ